MATDRRRITHWHVRDIKSDFLDHFRRAAMIRGQLPIDRPKGWSACDRERGERILSGALEVGQLRLRGRADSDIASALSTCAEFRAWSALPASGESLVADAPDSMGRCRKFSSLAIVHADRRHHRGVEDFRDHWALYAPAAEPTSASVTG